MNCDPNLADNYTPRQSFYIDQSIINPWLENFPRQESWLRNLLQVWLQKELAQTEAAFSIAIQRIVHAHGLRTYAVSPHIEILIRGNCESLFPSCVPRIRYDAMPRTSCHRDFLSRQQCNTKRFTRLRVYIYIFFSYFSPRPRRGKFYGNLGDASARNRIPCREELDDAVHTILLQLANLPSTIGRTNYANSVT